MGKEIYLYEKTVNMLESWMKANNCKDYNDAIQDMYDVLTAI